MEYEKEVAEKVWRGRRSGVVSPGCGGGVYARRSRSGRRGGKHRKYWLLSRKGGVELIILRWIARYACLLALIGGTVNAFADTRNTTGCYGVLDPHLVSGHVLLMFPFIRYKVRFPIVEPDYGHTKLRLSEQGLEAIRRIENPIAIVGVIGPYRSGKSFLLNQLLSLSCDKGIWIWGKPVEMDVDGTKVSVLYLDTEGFESVGKSNVYDDRIFALATVLSSVLIYNLPETVREADISRLSFAVEIAEEFYGRGKRLPLSQQSFSGLSRGISCIEMSSHSTKFFEQKENQFSKWSMKPSSGYLMIMVNQIRDSLAIMGNNSTAFSLPQVHLC
ncbi:Guanylate-binding protein 4 [Triticum urartu]|uniref:Guanylate-binding protein 4 n=1 Tax=Triticum urartu TaxID=4572 RepID=M7ZU11_TRIUA|nr:Guanylate-binding protein 4 [Triticum urartu]